MIEEFIRNAYKDRYGEEITEGKDKVIFSLAVSFFVGGTQGGDIHCASPPKYDGCQTLLAIQQ